MNAFRILAAAVLLTATTFALAQDVPTSKTYEVSIFEFRAPESRQGTVGFKPCEDCDYLRFRVTQRTQYVVDGRQVRLRKFRESVELIRLTGDKTVNVRRDEVTGTISRITVRSH